MATDGAPGNFIGRYRIIKRLGSGGMGDVFLAEDEHLGRKVALKVIGARLGDSEMARKRLLREARAAASIDHPNVCTVYEASEQDGVSFIAMQFVEGDSLAERARRSRLTSAEVREVAVQIGEALGAAHAHGIVHRDIKPQNVMLAASGRVIVVDFGLSSLLENEDASRLTGTGQVVGTPSYMSPEQMSSSDVDARSDLFSLGVLIYELLTSRSPFSRSSVTATIAAVLFEDPPLDDLPAEWRPVIAKALAKQRDRRFRNMREFLDALGLLGRSRDTSGQSDEPTQPLRSQDVKSASSERSSETSTNSLAVQPFITGYEAAEGDYFAEALTDSAIDVLSQIQGLRVMARSTVFRYRGDGDPVAFGRAMHVSTVLTGELRLRGEQYLLDLELVSVPGGERLWGARLDEPADSSARLHDRIRPVLRERYRAGGAAALDTPSPAVARNPEAQRHYLIGRHQWNRRIGPTTRLAIENFQQAIDLDPLMAPAYVGLADALSYMGFLEVMRPHDAFPRARAAAEQALTLDPGSGEALTSLAYVRGDYDFDFESAVALFQQALDANPNYGVAHHWKGLLMLFHGDIDAGEQELQKAQQLDPLNPILNVALAFPHYYRRDFARAISIYRGLLDLEPHFMPLYNYLGTALSVAGEAEEAVTHSRKAFELSAGSTIAAASLGYALARLGDGDSARSLLASLDEERKSRYSSPFAPAVIHAGLGDVDRALDWLEEAWKERVPWLLTTRMDPRFDLLRDDSRFDAFLTRVGFWGA